MCERNTACVPECTTLSSKNYRLQERQKVATITRRDGEEERKMCLCDHGKWKMVCKLYYYAAADDVWFGLAVLGKLVLLYLFGYIPTPVCCSSLVFKLSQPGYSVFTSLFQYSHYSIFFLGLTVSITMGTTLTYCPAACSQNWFYLCRRIFDMCIIAWWNLYVKHR